MFGLCPAAPTRAEDYAACRAGRPLRNTRARPRGLTPPRLAQLAGADLQGVQHATPDPWVPGPALVLTDVEEGATMASLLLDPLRGCHVEFRFAVQQRHRLLHIGRKPICL